MHVTLSFKLKAELNRCPFWSSALLIGQICRYQYCYHRFISKWASWVRALVQWLTGATNFTFGRKSNTLLSFAVQFVALMAYLRRQPLNTLCFAELSQSSANVLRLRRLPALSLPKSCSRKRLLHTSRFVRTTQFAFGARHKSCRISSGRIAKALRSPLTGQQKHRVSSRADVNSTDRPLLNLKQIVTPRTGQNDLISGGPFVDNLFEKPLALRVTDEMTMTIFQPFIVPETTSSPIKRAFTSSCRHDSDLGDVAHPLTRSIGKSSVVSSFDLTYSLDEGEYTVSFRGLHPEFGHCSNNYWVPESSSSLECSLY